MVGMVPFVLNSFILPQEPNQESRRISSSTWASLIQPQPQGNGLPKPERQKQREPWALHGTHPAGPALVSHAGKSQAGVSPRSAYGRPSRGGSAHSQVPGPPQGCENPSGGGGNQPVVFSSPQAILIPVTWGTAAGQVWLSPTVANSEAKTSSSQILKGRGG